MNIDQKQIVKAFYSDGYKLGMQAVKEGLTQDLLFEAIQKLYETIDKFLETLSVYVKKQGQKIDCKKGCEWCCHQAIYASNYEMQFLNDFVKTNFSDEEQVKIKKRAENKNNQFKNLENQKLHHAKHPCPLLENGTCMAYKARPMACRIYVSSDVKSCLQFFKNPESEKSIPALLEFPLKAGRMMNEGFKAAIKTGGLSAFEYRIEEILLDPPVKTTGTIT